MGNISVLSFDPTKNLNNYGSGGMILTDSFSIYESLLDIKDNSKHSAHASTGTNSKISEADAAQLLVKLRYFDSWQRRRQSIADYYISELAEWVDVIMPGPDVISAWSKFVIRLGERHGLQNHLAESGIDTRFHYDKPLFELPIGYNFIDYAREIFRESTAFSRECLSLPIYPELTDAEVEHIAEKITEYLR
jgi:dTDP-4-amino-4,6-dideoxygalactose transaminase